MNIINLFINWIFPKRNNNIIDVLQSFISKPELNRIMARTPDRRELIKSVSSHIGYSEQELIFLISDQLNFPVTFQLISDGTILKEENKETFYQAASFPIVQNGEMVGLACVDPFLCDEILTMYSNIPKWLTSWEVIKNAHNKSAHDIKQAQSNISYEVGKKVILSIVKESKKFLGQKVAIQIGEMLKYEILTFDSKTAKGSISEKARQSLEEFLLANAPSGIIESDDTIGLPSISVSHNEALNRYVLEWEPSEVSQANERSNVVTFHKPHPKNNQRKCRDRSQRSQVLVVEDNETFTKVLDRFLKKNGVEGIFAKDGREGLLILEKNYGYIRAIICDVHMPNMNGFEFIKTVRSNQLYESLPCIMLTSDTDVETELTFLNEGVDLFIGKQQDPRLLCFHINKILHKQNMRAA